MQGTLKRFGSCSKKKTDIRRARAIKRIWAVGRGWHGLIDRIVAVLPRETSVLQVKEKFGGLRFYVDSAPAHVLDVIDECEAESLTICEACGRPGKLREGGWLKTLCDEHAEIYKRERFVW